jgi:hypothetical protein
MADRLISQSRSSLSLARTNRPRIIHYGDSKSLQAGSMAGDSWYHWASALSGVDLMWSGIGAADNAGVSGGTCDTSASLVGQDYLGAAVERGLCHPNNLTKMRNRISTYATAGEYVVLWVNMGTNSTGDDTSHLAALQRIVTEARFAGASLILVNDTPPVGNDSTNQNANIMAMNARAKAWCTLPTNPDCRHLSYFESTFNPADALSNAIGGSAGAAGAATRDGVHEAATGAYWEGKALAAQIKDIFRQIELRVGGKGDRYQNYAGSGAYPTTALAANMLKNPFFTGTGGLNNSSGGTVTGGIPDSYQVVGGLGGITLTFSQVPNAFLNAKFGRTDFTACRMTLSGTPSANISWQLITGQGGADYPLINGNQPVIGQMAVQTNALVGVSGINFTLANAATGKGRNTNNTLAYMRLPSLSEFMLLEDRGTVVPSGGPPTFADPSNFMNLQLYAQSGVAVSGSIDLLFADTRIVTAIPASL